MDSDLKLGSQIRVVVKSSFFHLGQLARVKSADQLLLSFPKTKRKLRGDCAFAIAALKICNDLLQHIRQASSWCVFKPLPKTYLFSLAFDT